MKQNPNGNISTFEFEEDVDRNGNVISTSIFFKDLVCGVEVNIDSDTFKNNKIPL